MTENRALLLAGAAHILLLGLLSFTLARQMPMRAEPDVTPVEFVEIGPEPTVTTPPKPSMDASPRDPGPPPAEPVAQPTPPAPPQAEPKPAPEKPAPAKPAPDEAPQDAIVDTPKPKTPPPPKESPKKPAEKPAPEKKAPDKPQPKPPAEKSRPDFNAGEMASLIDKSLPRAATKPRDVSTFAKSIEQAIPQGVKVSPRQIATLEQAIRSQIAPCWNPPMGGADVQDMTAVLRIRLGRDGGVIGQPELVSQTGKTVGNQAYARAFVETAKRAVLRCAPLKLPDDLYSYWQEFELNFDPRLMT